MGVAFRVRPSSGLEDTGTRQMNVYTHRAAMAQCTACLTDRQNNLMLRSIYSYLQSCVAGAPAISWGLACNVVVLQVRSGVPGTPLENLDIQALSHTTRRAGEPLSPLSTDRVTCFVCVESRLLSRNHPQTTAVCVCSTYRNSVNDC